MKVAFSLQTHVTPVPRSGDPTVGSSARQSALAATMGSVPTTPGPSRRLYLSHSGNFQECDTSAGRHSPGADQQVELLAPGGNTAVIIAPELSGVR